MLKKIGQIIVFAGATLGLATVASAQTAPGLEDLIGARGSSVESELETRGYAFAGNLGSATLWWNARANSCVSVAVDQGRVQSIQTAPAQDCGHGDTARHTASSGHRPHENVRDLIGADAIHAIDVLSEWGFRSVDVISADDYIYSTYWKASTHECVQVTTEGNWVTEVDNVDHHPRCR
ncbi:MAG: hypothetical protein KDE63_13760 [Novosphingobium sp.]|nr:hypothetical protein [Novosphingobium sp.]